jgi:hypothetical protein
MKRSITVIAALLTVPFSAGAANAEAGGITSREGIETSMTSVLLDRVNQGLDLETGEPDKRVFEYTSATACATSIPDGANADIPCSAAIQACAGNTAAQGQGPQVRLYRRELDNNGKPVDPTWLPIGTTCFPELVPGKPVLGMARILDAFHNTAWALPAVQTQPEGNTTLVTLPTYFRVSWPKAGFQPGEVDTTTLLNTPVRIRPTLKSYTYIFGDGTSSEPTLSPGGTYPEGDITHAYPKAGSYSSHVEITYGGEFSIRDGEWNLIPDTVTIGGQPQTITVKTAHPRLVIR